jgi:Na+/H+-dicarboxylate symporter
MFRKMPVILLIMMAMIVCIHSWIPLEVKEGIYALSLSLKSLIIFVLPALIFMLLFKTLSQLSKQATKILLFILVAICVSNFLSTMISYQVGSALYHLDIAMKLPQESMGLTPLWKMTMPVWIANDKAMLAGMILGIVMALCTPNLAAKISVYFEKAIAVLLKVLSYLIPVFVCGFMIKLVHDGVIKDILIEYSLIFTLVAVSVFIYIGFLYFLSSRLRVSKVITHVKNMLPASIAGFSSMSSAAALPLTMVGVEKNVENTSLARLAVPMTVNTHLIGDCFSIPIFAFAVMKQFGCVEPAFASYLLFALYFVIAKFSVAAIPGGGIIVMLPILESQFGFTSEMSLLITALYVLFDPVITSANVMGNGAFALSIHKIWGRLTRLKKEKNLKV